LALYSDRDGIAKPTVIELADAMGLTPANVRRARAQLVAAGAIGWERSRGRRRNRYRFPFDPYIGSTENDIPNPRGGARVDQPSTRAVARVNPRGGAREPARWRAGVGDIVGDTLGAPVTVANGFALDATGPAGPEFVSEVLAAVRDRRFGEIPDA
jgi:hypothetical protein